MHQNNSQTFISYQGGSAGDLITASLNSIKLNCNQVARIQSTDFSLKNKNANTLENIQKVSSTILWPYISTHEVRLFLDSDLSWISLEVTDLDIIYVCIFRQMQLQRLRIKVEESSTWFQTVKSLCRAKKYQAAAQYWFTQSQNIWMNDMEYRIRNRQHATHCINLNELFNKKFAQQLQAQLPTMDISMLKVNHELWLEKNHPGIWSKQLTIDAMTNKLQQMDWTTLSGFIEYGG
jgi:hypothetical protein